jgi:hypothetical protein
MSGEAAGRQSSGPHLRRLPNQCPRPADWALRGTICANAGRVCAGFTPRPDPTRDPASLFLRRASLSIALPLTGFAGVCNGWEISAKALDSSLARADGVVPARALRLTSCATSNDKTLRIH